MSTQERTDVVPTSAPQGDRRLGLASLIIATARCMLVLDGTIMIVALPSIQTALRLPTADLNWVISGYALTFGGLLLVAGRAGDVFGRKTVFRIGLIVFTLASLLGGLSTGGVELIIARAVQGAGAAITAPAALSLLATTFPPGPARMKAFGLYGAMGGLGSVLGLLLGGALTGYLGWRWVLFVNIPIAIAVLLGMNVLVDGERDRVRLDLPGAVTATLGVGALVFAINRVSDHGWTDHVVLGCLVAAVLLLVAFLLVQRRSSSPMVPGRVLADRGRLGANLITFIVACGMFATYYFLTLYMQQVKGYSPMTTGLMYLPFALGFGIAAGGIGPKLLVKASERGALVAGLVLAIGGMGWFSMLTPEANVLAVLLPAQLVTGLGLGITFVAATATGVRAVPPADTGVASGLLNAGQQVGGAVGLAVLATVAAAVTGHVAHGTSVADGLTHGYTVGFLVGGALYVVSLVIALLTVKPLAPQQS